MGFLSTVGNFVSSAISAVGSICSSIGGAIMGTIGTVAKNIISIGLGELGPIGAIIQIITAVVSLVIGKPAEEKPEELGMKAQIADKKPEDFDSIEKYIEYLRHDIEVDKERMASLSEWDRAIYGAIGSGLYVKQMEEKYQMDLPVTFWKTAADLKNEGRLSDAGIAGTIQKMKEKNFSSAESVSDYVNGSPSLSLEQQIKVFDSLKESLRKEFPNASDSELNVRVSNIRNNA